jgi:predicted MPP superfamily phosphohydrolase
MRFKLLSDIHLEFYNSNFLKKLVGLITNPLHNNKDCNLILCGDIGKVNNEEQFTLYRNFLQSLSLEFKHIFLVPGNHEYYGSSYKDTNDKLKQLEEELKPNMTLMINNSVDLDDNITIIGSTLWSRGLLQYSKSMNDFKQISDLRKDKCDYLRWHFQDFEFLKKAIAEKSDKQLVVLTHHMPSYELIGPKYKHYDDINTFFANKLDYLMENNPNIKYWCYGHTHTANQHTIGTTHCIANPWGYPGENTVKEVVEFSL